MKRPAIIAKNITKTVTVVLILALIWPLSAHTDDFHPARAKETVPNSFISLTGCLDPKARLLIPIQEKNFR